MPLIGAQQSHKPMVHFGQTVLLIIQSSQSYNEQLAVLLHKQYLWDCKLASSIPSLMVMHGSNCRLHFCVQSSYLKLSNIKFVRGS